MKRYKLTYKSIAIFLALVTFTVFVIPRYLKITPSNIKPKAASSNKSYTITPSTELGEFQEQVIKKFSSLKDTSTTKDVESFKNATSAFVQYIQDSYSKIETEFDNNQKTLSSINALNSLDRQKSYKDNFEKNYKETLSKVKELQQLIKDPTTNKSKIEAQISTLSKIFTQQNNASTIGTELPHSKINFNNISSKEISALPKVNPKSLEKVQTLEPNSDDLEQTRDTMLTDQIKSISGTLPDNALSIYDYVRNNMALETYAGSVKGATGALEQKSGNDVDQASLLIALLRSKNIPSRYVMGTIEVPIDKAIGWTGASTADAAAKMLAQMDDTVTSCVSQGKTVAIRMVHTWVEAYVPFENYRGTGSNSGKKEWIPLDPSYKLHTKKSSTDIGKILGSDGKYIDTQFNTDNEIFNPDSITRLNTDDLNSFFSKNQSKIQDYLKNNGISKSTTSDITGGLEIVSENLGELPLTLPYGVVDVGAESSKVSDDLTAFVSFSLDDGKLNFNLDAPTLYSKNITLSWDAATDEDQKVIDKYGSIFKTPAYLVKLKPVLKIDGEIKAEGSAVNAGQQQQFTITIKKAYQAAETISNTVTSASYYCVGLDYSSISATELTNIENKLKVAQSKVNKSNVYSDEMIGQLLNQTIKTYFAHLDIINKIAAENNDIRQTRMLSEGMTGYNVLVKYLYGVPSEISQGSMYIDIDDDIHSSVSRSGDEKAEKAFMLTSGIAASSMEHGIFEELFKLPSVSTIKILQQANSKGIPIYSINSSNVDSILPKLKVSDTVKTDITNAINSGKTITIPEREVTLYDWTGSGYIVLDPSTGAAGYMISGGAAGGAMSNSQVALEFVVDVIVGLVFDVAIQGIELLLLSFLPGGIVADIMLIGQIVMITSMLTESFNLILDYEETGNIRYLQELLIQLSSLATVGLLHNSIFKDFFNDIEACKKALLIDSQGKAFHDDMASKGFSDDTIYKYAESYGSENLDTAKGMMDYFKDKGFSDSEINDIGTSLDAKDIEGFKDTVDKLSKDGYNDQDSLKDALDLYKNGESEDDIIKCEEGGCFTAGTLINTNHGLKPIENIKVGDEVYSKNEVTGENGYKKVEATIVKDAKILEKVYVGTQEIYTTENHPFWVENIGWTAAGNLKIGDKLKLSSGKLESVTRTSIEKHSSSLKVYNLIVSDWHTYYVSDYSILVHNGKCPDVEGISDEVRSVSDKIGFSESNKYNFLKGIKDGLYSLDKVTDQMKTEGSNPPDERAAYRITKSDNSTTVYIDESGKTVQIRWKVSSKGVRGNDYSKVTVPKGLEKGHIKSVQEGALDDPIDDGPLNVVGEDLKVNRSDILRFENYRVENCQGMEVVTNVLTDGNIQVIIEGKGINVTFDPNSTVIWPDRWFLRHDVSVWNDSSAQR